MWFIQRQTVRIDQVVGWGEEVMCQIWMRSIEIDNCVWVWNRTSDQNPALPQVTLSINSTYSYNPHNHPIFPQNNSITTQSSHQHLHSNNPLFFPSTLHLIHSTISTSLWQLHLNIKYPMDIPLEIKHEMKVVLSKLSLSLSWPSLFVPVPAC